MQYAFLLPEEYADKLRQLSKDSKKSQSQLFRDALKLLFEQHGIAIRPQKDRPPKGRPPKEKR